jgi:hypothetical protein
MPTSRSRTISVGPNGMMTSTANVDISISIGATLNTARSASAGMRSSFCMNFTPSARGWAQPHRPPAK